REQRGEQPEQTDQDQVDRDQIVENPGDQQDQDAEDQGDQRLEHDRCQMHGRNPQGMRPETRGHRVSLQDRSNCRFPTRPALCQPCGKEPEEASMATRISHKVESTGPRLVPKTVTIDPLTPVIGAEIGGVDLSRPLSPEQEAEIRAAQAAYHVLVFRDQVLSNDDHKRFARLFGRLHVHPYHAKKMAPEHAKSPDADPEILVVKANQKSKFVAGEEWHTDVSCDAEPPMGSMLYITQTPEIGGGDTLFLSTVR